MRIETEAGIGELSHVRAADEHETHAPQTFHGRRVGICRRGVGKDGGACPRDLPAYVEQVLDRDRDAGERRRRGIDATQPVHRAGGAQGPVAIDLSERARTFAVLVVDPRKARLDQFV